MFLYKKEKEQVIIFGYRGYDGMVRVPETVDGSPVTELAAYAFSTGWGREEVIASVKEEIHFCDDDGNPIEPDKKNLPPEINGEKLTELYLPEKLQKIGNYAFYNCFELSHMECYSTINDLGSGLFTGCTRVRYLDIYIKEGRHSCLKEMLSELKQELYVNYYTQKGKAMLVFPEMYEESVEHTPARIVFREMHGCGHLYRYCFDLTEFKFHKFDALLPHLLVQESEQVAAALVIRRLYTPLELLPQAKEAYEEYLKEHVKGAAKGALKDDSDLFIWLAKEYALDQKDFDDLVDMTIKEERTELLSVLMDIRRKRFPIKKRTFSLE